MRVEPPLANLSLTQVFIATSFAIPCFVMASRLWRVRGDPLE